MERMNVQQQQAPKPQASLYSQLQYQNQSNSGQGNQNGYVWNGSKWVVGGINFESGLQYSNFTYQQPKPPVVPTALPYGCNYEAYKASYEQAVRLKNEAAKPGISDLAKAELLREAQWAEYYSSLAYYGDTFSQQQQAAQAPSRQLPLPVTTVMPPTTITPTSPLKSDDKKTPENSAATAAVEYPESLQRYVNRITEGFKTESERKKAQEMVERVIANAVKNNALFTTDWDKCIVPTSSQTIGAPKSSSDSVEGSIKNPDIAIDFSAKDIVTNNAAQSKKRKWREISEAERHKKNSLSGNTFKCGPMASPKALIEISSDEDKGVGYYGPTSRKGAAEKLSLLSHGSSSNVTKITQVQVIDPSKDLKNPFSSDVVLDAHKTKTDFHVSLSKLHARANRFSDMNKQVGAKSSSATLIKSPAKNHFAQYMGVDVIGGGRKLDENDFERMTVKGTCKVLEKEYLRLTAPPQASKVRPLEILRLHMNNLTTMWMRKERDYTWFCSQLKAVRQDLTVQRINNEFTVEVYETHARIALEVADLNEFNQSQTQLKELYKVIREQKDEEVKKKGLKNMNEFIAYRLIYYVFLTLNKKYEGGSTDLMNIILSLTPDQAKDHCISYALKVREAVSTNNYHSFFRLYGSNAPRMSAFLLDFMVNSIRFSALRALCKAYCPALDVKFVLAELGFIVDDPSDWSEGVHWLKSSGCVLSGDDLLWNVKESKVSESALVNKRSLI